MIRDAIAQNRMRLNFEEQIIEYLDMYGKWVPISEIEDEFDEDDYQVLRMNFPENLIRNN